MFFVGTCSTGDQRTVTYCTLLWLCETLMWSDQCLASAANDKVVVTYIKGDVYDEVDITAGVSRFTYRQYRYSQA